MKPEEHPSNNLTYIIVDAENIFFSVSNKYGVRLNFHKVVPKLQEMFGDVRIFVFGCFSDDRKGLFFTTKSHLQSCPHTSVIDTKMSETPRKELTDRVMLEEITMGEDGLFRNPDLYNRAVFMTGDGSMLRPATHAQNVLGMETVVMAEEGTIKEAFTEAGIQVIHLDPIKNDFLVTNRLDG